MTIAFITENSVLALAIVAGWALLRQGGGLQVKPVPVPKASSNGNQDGAKP